MLKYPNLKDSPTKMRLLCHYLALEPVEKKRKKLLREIFGRCLQIPHPSTGSGTRTSRVSREQKRCSIGKR